MSYDLDPTGKSLRNKIIGETKTISLPANRTHLFIIPNDGPFYAESLFIKYTPTAGQSKMLVADVDYVAVFPYTEAARKLNSAIFAGVEFFDLTLSGTVTYTYQTIGGTSLSTGPTIAAIEAGFTGDPKFTKWDTLVTLPELPDVTYQWSLVNVDAVANAVAELEKVGIVAHLRPRFLPEPGEQVFIPSPEEIGLGNVPNYPAATSQQAIEGTEDRALMTPATTKAATNAEVVRLLSEIGYLIPVTYVGGLHITDPKTTVDYQGRVYAVRPQIVPYTTTGVWNVDKGAFYATRESDSESWVQNLFVVSGGENTIPGLGVVFDVSVYHDCMLAPQLILNKVSFLVHGVDYKLSDDKLYVSYPLAVNDKLVLYTKRSFTSISRENQINKVFVVNSSSVSFDISDKKAKPENIRVIINNFIMLNSIEGDYSIAGGTLTINYPIGIGDIVEVENIDSMPSMGRASTRATLDIIRP